MPLFCAKTPRYICRKRIMQSCNVLVGCLPVFWQNFMVDVRKPEVTQTVSLFNLGQANLLQPTYNCNGLQLSILPADRADRPSFGVAKSLKLPALDTDRLRPPLLPSSSALLVVSELRKRCAR
jgi:hypothetical protein